MTIQQICAEFQIGGRYVKCKELNTGNINSTYKVTFIRDGEEKNYAVQRINKEVFKKPDEVMDNMVRVTNYVRENIKERHLSTRRFVMRVFTTAEGKPYVIDEYGDYWRCTRFIPDSITYDSCENFGIIERAGEAFGRFQSCLDGFDANSLYITIPYFHDTIKRYENFEEAVKKDPLKRAKHVQNEIEMLLGFKAEAIIVQQSLNNGEIPYRVAHNDTKANNVSFDKKTGEALAVLDLDTVMPGTFIHDYGDAIRYIANAVVEDEPDITKVHLDLGKVKAFTKGFVSEVKENLTDREKELLSLGPFTMAVELATRFLADYLLGDTYFKCRYPGHNLDRARNQIALAQDMLNKKKELEMIIEKYL